MLDRDVASKLAKLLRMLRSNYDGEVIAAAGKITGMAAAHDIDWDAVLTPATVDLTREQMEQLYNAGYQRGIEEAAKAARRDDDWAPAGTPRTGEVGSRQTEVLAIIEAAGRAGTCSTALPTSSSARAI